MKAIVHFLSLILICCFFKTGYAITQNQSTGEVLDKKPDKKRISSIKPILPKMVMIPGGCFQMGSHQIEQNRQQNEKRHRVCVQRFQMAIHEVTIAEFKAFVAAKQYFSDAEVDYKAPGCWSFDNSKEKKWDWRPWANWRRPLKTKMSDDMPVTCVSYFDINHYIQWLNDITGENYRLPTEAEWEYAARAKSNHNYYWGNHPDLSCRYANSADQTDFSSVSWPEPHQCRDGYFFTAPVKRFTANKYGLYDMLGNVWEWTCSEFTPDYQGQELQCLTEINNEQYLAVRGGGWNADPARLRVAYRNWQHPWARLATWGFRLVKDMRPLYIKR